MRFVCPACKQPVTAAQPAYRCASCARTYPIIHGIPDFRLYPDPYISIEEDRRKGERLFAAGRALSFAELVRHYFAITPEVPPDHAARWTAHHLAQPAVGAALLGAVRLEDPAGALLDVGCSTAGLLAAAEPRFSRVAGVDVAFRWLIVAQARLREQGVSAALVCANAEALPFPDGTFAAVTAIDTLEHVHDARAALREARRVSASGARTVCVTNNRYALRPDPQVGIWGVGYVPRRWQRPFVAWRRRGLREYCVSMRSARELEGYLRDAGYRRWQTGPAPLFAPHAAGRALQTVLAAYNRLSTLPLVRAGGRLFGPSLSAIAEA